MATPGIVGERHYALAQEIRRTLAQYAELKDIIAMLGLEQLSPEDRKVVGARAPARALPDPAVLHDRAVHRPKGKLVSLEDALDGCERILRDEFKDYPESALYMIGAIDEGEETRTGRADFAAGRPSRPASADSPVTDAEAPLRRRHEPLAQGAAAVRGLRREDRRVAHRRRDGARARSACCRTASTASPRSCRAS